MPCDCATAGMAANSNATLATHRNRELRLASTLVEMPLDFFRVRNFFGKVGCTATLGRAAIDRPGEVPRREYGSQLPVLIELQSSRSPA